MKLNNQHVLYKQADVACSGPQLVLLLCDGAMRYLREAVSHMTAGRWAEKGRAVDSAYECIAELRHCLNLEHGGDVARNLDKTYDFLLTKLMIGNADRDPRQIEQIIVSLQAIREGWQGLFDRLRAEGKLRDAEMAGV